ncbi:zinc finger MYM-type protein 1-like, partial [Centruroides vittatus]|uniref:zinc finger MYM-type protein 1-like n=1 Tax=Centruroides vittatus TaxID=120091 RepID=UPI00350F7FE3
MSMPRKYPSGCQKRKLAEKKKVEKLNFKKSQVDLFSWLRSNSSNEIVSTSEVTVQASTGEESSAQTTQSCNENVETVKFVEEPHVYTNMIESENNVENDNNEYDQMNISDPDLWPSIITDKFRMFCVKTGPVQHKGVFAKNDEACNNLPLRGTHEIIGTPNNGNFLSLIEFLSKYDSVLMDHINRIKNSKNRIVHHLAHRSQEQIISALGDEVLNKIKNDIKAATYYSVQMDCTPDISHKEQTSVIIRYVNFEEKRLIINESFIRFIEATDVTGEGLAKTLLKTLSELDLDIMNCRGQGYDNGSNMKWKYKGVQSRIIALNPHAIYVPCLSHSFNLLICDAASSSIYCKNFFGILQRLYCLFSASTKRWEILQKHLNITLKPLCDTRWEAKIDSVKAVYTQFEQTCNALEEFIYVSNDNTAVSEAKSLLDSIQEMPFILCLVVWFAMLSKINAINILFQAKTIILESAFNLVNKIKTEIQNLRTKFNTFLDEAKVLARNLNISEHFPEKRIRKRKRLYSEIAEDEVIENPVEEFRCYFFNTLIDTVIVQIEDRFKSIPNIISDFKLITDMKTLEKHELEKCSKNFVNFYNKDVDENLIQEIGLLRDLILNERDVNNAQDILQYILNNNYNELFLNVLTVLKLFFTLPVTIASAERSFSKLKLIKNYLRSSMCAERLNALAILSIEKEIAKNCNFSEGSELWELDHLNNDVRDKVVEILKKYLDAIVDEVVELSGMNHYVHSIDFISEHPIK